MKLKYFLPNWEDRLDPDFDFIGDRCSAEHKANPYEHDVYAHQLFKNPPYDGILLSLSVFQSKISLSNSNGRCYNVRGHTSIKEYLKIPQDSSLEVMGDCGAFGYASEKKPPQPFYSVENVAAIYDRLGFDYGVSVDHVAARYVLVRNQETGKRERRFLSKEEKDTRIQITLENAERFLKLHTKLGYSFVPIGVAQGYDLHTYRRSVQALVEMGYEYIGIGGLVQYQSSFITNLLKTIEPLIRGKSVHLFGISRPESVKEFEMLGVTSLDSASFLRKAWLRSGQNYLGPNGKWYAAVRIPDSDSARLISSACVKGYSQEDLKQLERRALDAVNDYDQGKISLAEVLSTILKYDELLIRTSDRDVMGDKYERTLREQPWKACSCDVCRKLGIHVVIFRGSNRNKRRGFHNAWVFHEGLTNGNQPTSLYTIASKEE